jgi:predicted metalloprotease
VQDLSGVLDQSGGSNATGPATGPRSASVQIELQADCLAGVWGYNADKSRHILEAGDLEEALRAASAIGDDRIMKQTRGTVVPDAFTHGTSEQRVRWFKRGFETGDLNQCDTFKANPL